MTTKHDAIRVHREHPDWHSEQIARELGCVGGYVRETAKRNGLILAKGEASGRNLNPNLWSRLGRAASKAGMTIEDIENWRRLAPVPEREKVDG